MTLHSDGTTKHGRFYTTFDLINEQSKLLVCELWEVGAADAQNAENNSVPIQQYEVENVERKMLKVSGSGSRHKKRAKVVTDNDWKNENKVPVVSNGRELVEKVVEHLFFFDEGDKKDWHRGVVLAMPRKYRL